MLDIINLLWANKEWLFSGIGGVVLLGCLGWIIRTVHHWLHKQDNEPKQTQITGDNGVNIQTGGNLTVNNSHFGGKDNVK